MWSKLWVFYVFRCFLLGIWPLDHHHQHRLDRAVILVVSILKIALCGQSYECFTFLGVWLEFDLRTTSAPPRSCGSFGGIHLSNVALGPKLWVFYVFSWLFVGIWPQDHHKQHRLARAVILVVSICQTGLCGQSYECFTFLGAYLLEFYLKTIIISTASLVRSVWWYPLVRRAYVVKVMSVLRV